MIRYGGTIWGLGLLFRGHGSAVARAVVPSLLSTGIYFLFYFWSGVSLADQHEWRVVEHPYAVGALVAAFAFLLVFRANHAYERYWGAAASVYRMMSKWQDVGMVTSAFHYESVLYDKVRPPSFGEHPDLDRNMIRERQRLHRMHLSELEGKIDEEEPNWKTRIDKFLGLRSKAQKKIAWIDRRKKNINASFSRTASSRTADLKVPSTTRTREKRPNSSVVKMKSNSRLDGGMGSANPSLFLQELCHLLSLMNAVALSTLRDDRELGESSLVEYVPGDPLPPEDPDDLPEIIRREYREDWFVERYFRFVFGLTRTVRSRALYNAARPFGVLGGVSDAECNLIQAARGSCAKVALCSMWLFEFVTREAMMGSTGKVAPPIISRIHQTISDGMLGYNEARKVSMIPFPFPHAQICSVFIAILGILFPTLYLSYSQYLWYGSSINFLTMLCFTGLHEVARELENPFQNTPNDLPLSTFQAQFNEALVTMYAGFHPDAYWVVAESDVGAVKTGNFVGKEMVAKRESDVSDLTPQNEMESYGSICRN